MQLKTLFISLCLIGVDAIAQFGPRQLIYEHPISGGRMIRTADFDNDGDQDAVIAILDFIAWYPNDGDGNFGAPNPIELNMGGAYNIYPVDIDADSHIDLVVSYSSEDKVVWYKNLGGGAFSNLELVASSLNKAFAANGEDIDDDGDVDLVLGVVNGSGLYWVENLDGEGTFGSLIPIDASLGQARRQRLGDMDGDGDIDVVSNGSNSRISWFENVDGQGDFSIQHIVESQGLYENAFDLEDLDGDGDLDIVSGKEDDLIWRENLDGLGNFGPATIINSSNGSVNVSDIHIADLDNDGFLDVLTSATTNSIIAWYKNTDGLGTFGPQQLIETELFFPRSVYTADLDSDGDLDVLTSTVHPNEIGSYWFENFTVLGVEENEKSSIVLYPNPAKKTVTIKNSGNKEILAVKVYDVLGRLIFTKEKEFNYIDVSNLATGLFFVHVLSEEGMLVNRLVKE